MTLHGLPSHEQQYVSRTEMAAIMGISVPTFDHLRARCRSMGNPCPQQSWGLHRVVFWPPKVLAWAEALNDERREVA